MIYQASHPPVLTNETDGEVAKQCKKAEKLVASGKKVKVAARLLHNCVEYQRAEKNLIVAATQKQLDEFLLHTEVTETEK